MDPNPLVQLHLHEPVKWFKFSYFSLSIDWLRYLPRRTAHNEVVILWAWAKHIPHHISLSLFGACFKGRTLAPNTSRLTSELQKSSTIFYQNHEDNGIQTPKALAHLLSITMFRGRRAIPASLLPCILDLWSTTGCHTDAIDASNYKCQSGFLYALR